jgi:hypothetical protein
MATLLADITNLVGVSKRLLISNQSKIGNLFIDATHLENIEYSSVITEHYIESGSTVSDHINIRPLQIRMEGSITDSSVDIVGNIKDIMSLFSGNIQSNVTNKLKGKSTKQIMAYELLVGLHANKSPLTIVNYLNTFDNMFIENLIFPRDNTIGNRLFFQITLKQINFATVKTIDILLNSKSVQDMISNKFKTGRQQTIAPTATEQTRGSSAAINLKNNVIEGANKFTNYIGSFF